MRLSVIVQFGGVIGAGVLLSVLASRATSQAPAKAQAGGEKPTPIFFGVSACIDCHSKGMTNPVLCRCTEVLIWEKDDKHRDAYKVLLGERSQAWANCSISSRPRTAVASVVTPSTLTSRN